MTETTFDTINSLGDYFFIAGSDQVLYFNCTDENGAVLNITGATCSIKVSPYGQPNVLSLSKAGTITDAVGGVFKVALSPSDTTSLSGKYLIQPHIIDFSGVLFLPAQGILTIAALIA